MLWRRKRRSRPRARAPWRATPKLPVLIALLVGAALSVAVFFAFADLERMRAREAFERAARDRFLVLARELEQSLLALQSVGAYLRASPGAAADAFAAVTRPLLALSPAQQAMAWAPREAETWRLTRVFPAGGVLGPGVDLGSVPAARQAARLARETGRVALSEALRGDDGRDVLVALPVYRTALADPRAAEPLGLALVALDLRRLIETALARLEPARIELRLFDLDAPPGRRLLYHPLDGLPGFEGLLDDPAALEGAERLEQPLEIAQRHWLAVATPAAGQFLAQLGWRPWATLAIGLATTLAVAFYLYGVVGRRVEVEAEVAARGAALAERERRLRQLVEPARDAFWLASIDGQQLLYVSPAAEALLGHPVELLLARPALRRELIHPDDRERRRRAVRAAAAAGYELEYRIVRADGALRWVRERAYPVRDADGEVDRLGGVIEDVTERRRDGQAQAAGEARARGALAAAPAAVIMLDAAARIDGFNPAAERLFGVSAADAAGQPLEALLPGFDPRLAAPHELVGVCRDGHRFPAHVAVAALPEGGFVGVVQDVSALKQAPPSERREAGLGLDVFAQLMDAVLATDALGRVEYLNPAAERLLDCPRQQALGRRLAEVVRLRDAGAVAALPLTAPTAGPQSGVLARADGEREVFYALALRRSGPDAAIGGVVLVLHEAGQRPLTRDPLTGLADRPALLARLEALLARGEGERHALAYLQIEDLKGIAAVRGQADADAALCGLTERLRGAARPCDVLARVGADEFAVLLDGLVPDDARAAVQALRAAVEGWSFERGDYSFGFRIWVGLVGLDAGSALAVMTEADLACHRARRESPGAPWARAAQR